MIEPQARHLGQAELPGRRDRAMAGADRPRSSISSGLVKPKVSMLAAI